MPTTAGSLALAQNLTGRDAAAVARLRAAGAVILGKTNLSEWAHVRGNPPPPSGWSAVGGLTVNPYDPQRNACGSSSGSGAATAASFAAAALATDTDGSIACPSAVNGLVGLRPTLGLVSRRHVVPISPMQDTVGPMARTVTDAALLLAVIAGTDALDPETAEADRHVEDYVAALKPAALAGKRLGVVRAWMGYSPALDAVFEARLESEGRWRRGRPNRHSSGTRNRPSKTNSIRWRPTSGRRSMPTWRRRRRRSRHARWPI